MVGSSSDCIPLIISGAPRSGKSLLYTLIEGHSEVSWLIDEGLLFEYLYQIRALGPGGAEILLASARRGLDDFILGIRDKQVMPPVENGYRECGVAAVVKMSVPAPWDEEAFRSALKTDDFNNVGALWQVLARACLAGLGQEPRRYCCMMVPDYGKSAAAVLETVSDAKAVFIVRDPARTLDSLKRGREKRGVKLVTWPAFAMCLAEMNAMAERARNADKDRCAVIRHEDLTADPEGVMHGVADWLGIAFEPGLLEPTVLGEPFPGASVFTPMNGVDPSSVTRPIHALNEAELALIDNHLGPYREFFGY